MLDARNMLRIYSGLRDLANVPKIRFHDLRHSAATLLRAAGVLTPAIRNYWDTLPREVYSHVISDMEIEAAAKMESILNPVAVKSPPKRPS